MALDVPLTCECAAELPRSTGIPIGAPGTWTLTVKINDVEMGSKNVVVASGAGRRHRHLGRLITAG